MSRHHILPPIVYTPAPPKPKEARRKRNAGSTQARQALGAADEAEETSEATHTQPARGAPGLPQYSTSVEAAQRRVPSPNGKLSDGTLKAILEAQEKGEH